MISVCYQVRQEEADILDDILWYLSSPFFIRGHKKLSLLLAFDECDVTKWIIANTLTGILLELSTCSGFQLVSKLPPRWLWRLSWIVYEVYFILWPGRLNFWHQYKNFIACQCAELLLLGVSNIIDGWGLVRFPNLSQPVHVLRIHQTLANFLDYFRCVHISCISCCNLFFTKPQIRAGWTLEPCKFAEYKIAVGNEKTFVNLIASVPSNN